MSTKEILGWIEGKCQMLSNILTKCKYSEKYAFVFEIKTNLFTCKLRNVMCLKRKIKLRK